MTTCRACIQKCHREHSSEHVQPCFLLEITNLGVPQDLIIPKQFFRKYCLDIHKSLTLVGPTGDTWRIAHRRNGRLSGSDWAKFAQQNGLLNRKQNLIVLFELVGVSSFYVKIMGRNGCAVIPDQEQILHPKGEKDEVLKNEVDLSISSEFEKMRHRDGLNLDHAWAHDHPHASSKANLEYITETFKAHEVQPVFCKGGRRNCKAERERITKLTDSMTIKGPSAIAFFTRKCNYTLRISRDIAMRFLPKYDKKAILIDFLGEKWPMWWRWKANQFSCGWNRFYQHHHLSINHACMIELVEAESLTLKVTIFSLETRPEQQVKKMELQEITCPKDRFNHDSSKRSLLKKWIKSFPSHIFQWSNRWSIILKDSVLMLE